MSAFQWPADTDPESHPSERGVLPATGPLAEFAARADVLREPEPGTGRPWVLACGDRVVKAYDLRAIWHQLDKAQAIEEATTAELVGDVPGVVTTYRTGQLGHWLILEMERLGPTMSERVASGPALSEAEWGEQFEGVARALGRLHARGVIHHDIKPDNLLFDRAGEHLLVGDFSISERGRRFARTARAKGTSRYIAPELFDGRLGPAIDQYALAITAGEVIDSERARAVLQRATARDPGDRYADVADFGADLRAATDPRRRRRLSARLEGVSPQWRHAWGPGASTAVLMYVFLCVARLDLPLRASLFLPLLFGAVIATGSRGFSRFRDGRTRPRLAIADRPWFSVAVFVALFVAMAPVLLRNPDSRGRWVLVAGVMAFGLTAWLGSLPADAGVWLTRRVRRWERWRDRHRGRPLRWWGVRAGVVAVLAVLTVLPRAIAQQWPPPVERQARELGSLAVVAEFRRAAALGDASGACARTLVLATSDTAECQRWVLTAGDWMQTDVATGHGAALTPEDLETIETPYVGRQGPHARRTWLLLRLEGGRRYEGTIEVRDERRGVLQVTVSRRRERGNPLDARLAEWRYELMETGGAWMITSVEVCDVSRTDRCLRLAELPAGAYDDVIDRWEDG